MFKNDSVPAEVDIQIRMGIARGEKAKRTRKIRKLSSVAVLLIMAVFLGTINISSVAANYLASALGMENLVIWLRLGRPINNEAEFVIENRYLQHVNVSTEQDGVTFTIEDIIIDSTGMVAICSVENNGDIEAERLTVDDIVLYDKNGDQFSRSHTSLIDEKTDKSILKFSFNNIMIDNGPRSIPNDFLVSAKIRKWLEGDNRQYMLDGKWEVELNLDNSNLEDRENHFDINKSVVIADQEINFEKVILYPTKVAVDMVYDNDNTMNIFEIENLHLVDESGIEWRKASGGLYDTPELFNEVLQLSENKLRIFFDSPYFNEPKGLTLKGDRIRALDKNARVVIDVYNKKLLEAPDDKFTLLDVKLEDNQLTVEFDLKIPPEHYDIEYFKQGKIKFPAGLGVMGKCYDADGKLISKLPSSWKYSGFYYCKYSFEESFNSPISIEIKDYPNPVGESFEVKILE